MENKKEFEKIYEELQNNSNEMQTVLEEAKEEQKKLRKIQWPLCLIIDGIMIYFIMKGFNSTLHGSAPIGIRIFPLLIMIIVIDTMICTFTNLIFGKKQRQYKIKFKEIIIKELISNFYDNLEYFPEKEMPSRIYNEGKYKEYYNRYYSDDYIEAKINNKYDIGIAEVITQEVETHRDSNGHTRTTTTTKFHGLFTKIVIDKSICSELRIERNMALNSSKDKLEMDSVEFEKIFDVKSSNKIIGMQILTADIMEMLIDFRNKTETRFDIVVNNNEIYLRFHCGSMFEAASLKKGAFDEGTLRKYYNILQFTYNLSDKLIEVINNTQI